MGDERLPTRGPDKNQRPVVIACIYYVDYSARNSLDKVKRSYFAIYIHCLMMGDEHLPKRSPNISQRLVVISGIYNECLQWFGIMDLAFGI